MRRAESHIFSDHGGRLDEAARLFPAAPRPWLDLSTGINPERWTPAAPLPVDLARLPSRDALASLERAAADWFGASPERVLAVPGSEIALRLLPAAGLPRPIASLTGSYGTHEAVADLEVDELAKAPSPGALLIANPNNPDGRLRPPNDLLALAAARAGGWLAVDEAFIDATPGHGLAPRLTGDEPIVVLRSFGKFFGLAGVRLGFVIAPDRIVARYRALLGDWPVSAHALAHGTAAYRDRRWIDDTRHRLRERAAALDASLARHGLEGKGDCPLFRLVETPDAAALFTRLAAAGILTRPFADRPTWLRFGLPGGAADDDRLDAALARG